MDAQERNEVRQMISDLIAPLHTEILAQGKLTNLSLNNIDHRLDKLNGAVARHEKVINDNLPHTIANCPQQNVIQQVRDNMVTGKTMRKYLVTTITSFAAICTIIFIFYQIFIK